MWHWFSFAHFFSQTYKWNSTTAETNNTYPPKKSLIIFLSESLKNFFFFLFDKIYFLVTTYQQTKS